MQHHPIKDLATGAVVFVAGWLVYFRGFNRLKLRRTIAGTATSKIRSLALGPAEVQGRARPLKVLTTPFSNIDCVFFRYTVEEEVRRGKETHWVTIARDDSAEQPFEVDDGTGKVQIFPKGAELVVEEHIYNKSFWRNTLPAQATVRIEGTTGRNLRYHEWFIPPLSPVFVFGVARSSSASFETEGNLAISRDADEYFVISTRAENDLLAKLGWSAFGFVFLGPAVALLGAWMIFDSWKHFH